MPQVELERFFKAQAKLRTELGRIPKWQSEIGSRAHLDETLKARSSSRELFAGAPRSPGGKASQLGHRKDTEIGRKPPFGVVFRCVLQELLPGRVANQVLVRNGLKLGLKGSFRASRRII